MWPLHPGGYQKICSGGPEKCPQDGRIALLKPLFWHAKHAQNVRAKFVPDSIGGNNSRGIAVWQDIFIFFDFLSFTMISA